VFSIGDDLARMVAERSAANPDFGLLVEAYQQNSDLLDALADMRRGLGLSQRAVAGRMGTSQAAVDRLESTEVDPKLSTVQRLAVALGGKVKWQFVPAMAAQGVQTLAATQQDVPTGAGWRFAASNARNTPAAAARANAAFDGQRSNASMPNSYTAATAAMSATPQQGVGQSNSDVITQPVGAGTPQDLQSTGVAA